MDTTGRLERRRHPRIKQTVPLRIKQDGYDFVSQTQDISCLGSYCTVDKHIPVFSIVSIILQLPFENKNCNIRCKGVIVRVDKSPTNESNYNIAIYFNEIKESDKAKLFQYIQQHVQLS